ncbi:MAG TPA: YicC/YloC family endoribonuclease, partial [Steroidobacteraceae bacterium]|nr:YicC/YloC family endoribonuclease [Steroidobacteraceae bacterium]
MTGFARRENPGPWGTLICELRAVNHRYLELSIRLPEDLRSIENEARKSLGATLKRGKVDAAVYLKGSSASAPALEL